jgi:hypothetical protein
MDRDRIAARGGPLHDIRINMVGRTQRAGGGSSLLVKAAPLISEFHQKACTVADL